MPRMRDVHAPPSASVGAIADVESGVGEVFQDEAEIANAIYEAL